MLDITNVDIKELAIHYVGNKENGQDLLLAKKPIALVDERIRMAAFSFFVEQFKVEEVFHITHTTGNFKLNPVYQIISDIFSGEGAFITKTRELAKHLYQITSHPNIKNGELFVVHLTGLVFDGHKVEGVGIFKSDAKEKVLVTSYDNDKISLLLEEGISGRTLDKGVLLFNHKKQDGYRCLVIDKTNKTLDAKFWKEIFLGVEQISTSYSETRGFIRACKEFIEDVLPEDNDTTKTNQISLLRKSLDYLEQHETINLDKFKRDVFQDKNQEKSFTNYLDSLSDNGITSFGDSFQVSNEAYNKYSKRIKSVLKLDKNFHVYIHGDNSLIENGYDTTKKMKYYKIYYSEEN